MEENRQGAVDLRAYLTEKDISYHGYVIRTLQIPKIFNDEDLSIFDSIVNTTYRIFEKVIAEYLNNEKFRTLFPFSKELEALILTPRGYDSLLPIARFDIFYNEETRDFKFCEINTDGTSAMNEDRMLRDALRFNPAHQEICKTHEFSGFELFDSWVKTFLEIYHTYKNRVAHPHVAIVDFLDHVQLHEFVEFERHFNEAGISCEVCDIRELTYRDHKLYSPSGKQIHAIYRRVVTTDVISHAQKLDAFLEAVKHEDVCIIGAFCTQIVHNKWLFYLLHTPEVQTLLTKEEIEFVKAHIPETGLLDEGSKDRVIAEKDRWLIKPLDSYASKGVYAGRDCTDEEWENHIHLYCGHDYIYQEYCSPYRTDNIDFIEKESPFLPYTNMTGLYVYNGKFSGIYSRQSSGNIISSQYNERDNASLILKK